ASRSDATSTFACPATGETIFLAAAAAGLAAPAASGGTARPHHRGAGLARRRRPRALQPRPRAGLLAVFERLEHAAAHGGGALRLGELALAGDHVEGVDRALAVVVDVRRLDRQLGLGEDP